MNLYLGRERGVDQAGVLFPLDETVMEKRTLDVLRILSVNLPKKTHNEKHRASKCDDF